MTLLAPAVRGRKGIYKELFQAARKLGFQRARVDGELVSLQPIPALARYREHDIDIVVGELQVGSGQTAALGEHVATALRLGGGAVVAVDEAGERLYSERLYCVPLRRSDTKRSIRACSPSTAVRAPARSCDGLGTTTTFEPGGAGGASGAHRSARHCRRPWPPPVRAPGGW